jgi:hypothetical protein
MTASADVNPTLGPVAPDAALLFLNSGIFLIAATAVFLDLFFSSTSEG